MSSTYLTIADVAVGIDAERDALREGWAMLRGLLRCYAARLTKLRPGRLRDASRTRAGLVLEVLEKREVMTLSPIAATASYPYTSIVKLIMTFPDNKTFIGSGALIDSFHVLTAGHCTYSKADGGWAKSIEVIPEMNYGRQPFGVAWMTYERTYNTFINFDAGHPGSTSPEVKDIALLTLNRNIGNLTGWMGFGYDNNNSHFGAGHIMNTAGYPGSPYNGQAMYFSSGPTAGVSSGGGGIQYYFQNITTYGGQSGSPVWDYNTSTGARTIYGVVAGGGSYYGSLNFATRITQSIYSDLLTWRNSDRRPTTNGFGVGVVQGAATIFGSSYSIGVVGGVSSIATTQVPTTTTKLLGAGQALALSTPAEQTLKLPAKLGANPGKAVLGFPHPGGGRPLFASNLGVMRKGLLGQGVGSLVPLSA